jgi:hypothetical protein
MGKEMLTKEFLEEKYINSKKSMLEIGKEVGCSESWVWNKLREFGIPRRNNPKYTEKTQEELSKILTKKFLEELYVNQRLNSYRIAELVPCHSSTVIEYLRKHDIKVRGIKGKDNYRWRGGITPLSMAIRNSENYFIWFLDVLKRDKKTCQECGSKKELEAHHIKEFSEIFKEFLQIYSQFSPIEDKETLLRLALNYAPFWDITNGKTLCYSCHTKKHKRKKNNDNK